MDPADDKEQVESSCAYVKWAFLNDLPRRVRIFFGISVAALYE